MQPGTTTTRSSTAKTFPKRQQSWTRAFMPWSPIYTKTITVHLFGFAMSYWPERDIDGMKYSNSLPHGNLPLAFPANLVSSTTFPPDSEDHLMFTIWGPKRTTLCDGVSRREFLR